MKRLALLCAAVLLLVCVRCAGGADIEITDPESEVLYIPHPASDMTISGTCVHPEFEYWIDFAVEGNVETSIEACSPFGFFWNG